MAGWVALREALAVTVWPEGGGALPTEHTPASREPTAFADLTKLVWHLSCAHFSLNATAYHSVRSPAALSATAVVHHHGHGGECHTTFPDNRCDGPRSFYDLYNVTDFYHSQLRADIFFLYMPLYGPNAQQGLPADHEWFEQWQRRGVPTIKFFVEPAVRTISYALAMGYQRVLMVGKSGGGWTTTLTAALDARVALSFPIAGSLPLSFAHKSWDFEQKPRAASDKLWYLNVANYTTLYALATLDAAGRRTRSSLQLLHEDDPCCFYGRGRHAQILAYEAQVRRALPPAGEGAFAAAVTDWDVHSICPMDRAVLRAATQAVDARRPAFGPLPCDILHPSSPPCPFPPPRRAAPPRPTPPLFRVAAASVYDAGVQHGALARERIRGWLATEEMRALRAYVTSRDGAAAFGRMKAANAAAFPALAAELRGIAEGAAVDLDLLWGATLISEIESLMNLTGRASHCTDVYAVAQAGGARGFAHGHNEDWPGPVAEYFYFLAYTALPGADFTSCAGFAYPGALVGWASTWNDEGMYLTQNSLFPTTTRRGGLGSAFIQRQAICPAGPTAAARRGRAGMDDVKRAIQREGWSSGASLNLVDLVEGRMANVEVHMDASSVFPVLHEAAGYSTNYSHMNMYKTLERGTADVPHASTLHRQARVDALPAPRSAADVRMLLSDASDPQYPIFRNMTLVTMVLNGTTGDLDVWCCGVPANSGAPPAYRWNAISFFRDV